MGKRERSRRKRPGRGCHVPAPGFVSRRRRTSAPLLEEEGHIPTSGLLDTLPFTLEPLLFIPQTEFSHVQRESPRPWRFSCPFRSLVSLPLTSHSVLSLRLSACELMGRASPGPHHLSLYHVVSVTDAILTPHSVIPHSKTRRRARNLTRANCDRFHHHRHFRLQNITEIKGIQGKKIYLFVLSMF